MAYKFNSGEGAYLCDNCNKITCTGWDAVAMREADLYVLCTEYEESNEDTTI